MQPAEKQKVLQAIRDLGHRVTAADVAAKTGLPLNVVTCQLNTVAAETGGHLEVATTGDIAYRFAPGFQNAYLTKGMFRALEQFASLAFKVGFYLLRISFGIMLILSLVLLMILFLVIMMRGSSGNRDGGRINFRFGFFDYLVLRDLLYWGAYAAYPSPYERDRAGERRGNFLLSCFSFLFGDGNPNAHLEERRWQLIAQVVRNNNGVVTAEQLAPYTGADPTDEDKVLPLLVRFDGRPEVTESGNIVYVFPSLQVSAASWRAARIEDFLVERPWKFSNAPGEALVPVFILAAINLLGSWWLFLHVISSRALADLAFIATILVAYGTFFVILPFGRWLVQQQLNQRIAARNARRLSYARMLQEPDPNLAKKLGEASAYRIDRQTISADQVVYSTERDTLEQEFEEELNFKPERLEKKQSQTDPADR